jgi:hypothetical protein
MQGVDFLLNDPLPKGVFEGHIPKGSEARYVVIEKPEIFLEIPKGLH